MRKWNGWVKQISLSISQLSFEKNRKLNEERNLIISLLTSYLSSLSIGIIPQFKCCLRAQIIHTYFKDALWSIILTEFKKTLHCLSDKKFGQHLWELITFVCAVQKIFKRAEDHCCLFHQISPMVLNKSLRIDLYCSTQCSCSCPLCRTHFEKGVALKIHNPDPSREFWSPRAFCFQNMERCNSTKWDNQSTQDC